MFDIEIYNQTKKKFNDLRIEKEYIQKSLTKEHKNTKKLFKEKENAEKAREIMILVAQKTQNNLCNYICSLVTPAIQSVFQDDSEFHMEFVNKRNKTECEIWVEQNGNKIDPVNADGGGLADVLSFILRITFWKIDNNKSRPIFWADEPFKFLHSSRLQENCSEMISMLSEDFDIQMVIISDQDDIVGTKRFVIENGKVLEEG